MLGKCWFTVYDACPTLHQDWLKVFALELNCAMQCWPNVFDVVQHRINAIQMFCVFWDISTHWIRTIGWHLVEPQSGDFDTVCEDSMAEVLWDLNDKVLTAKVNFSKMKDIVS